MTKIPKLTLKSGNKIPQLGIGTWMIGGSLKKDPNNNDAMQIKAIKYALDNGFSLIRTAQNYAEGYCEELIGKSIQDYDRKKLFLISAVNQNYATSAGQLVDEAKKSLKRLKTDYFDIYIIGAIHTKVPISEIAKGLLELKSLGLTKDIGTSNYRLSELEIMQELTGGQIVYNEMHYNLLVREPEVINIFPFCKKQNIVLSAYRPLQLKQLAKPGIALLDWIAFKHNKSQAQVALKWLLSKDGVVTIPKMTTLGHIDEALDLFSWDLDVDEIESLNMEFPIQTRISDCSVPREWIK
jgi:diketogulonate reductase-like aldo/keto reductase